MSYSSFELWAIGYPDDPDAPTDNLEYIKELDKLSKTLLDYQQGYNAEQNKLEMERMRSHLQWSADTRDYIAQLEGYNVQSKGDALNHMTEVIKSRQQAMSRVVDGATTRGSQAVRNAQVEGKGELAAEWATYVGTLSNADGTLRYTDAELPTVFAMAVTELGGGEISWDQETGKVTYSATAKAKLADETIDRINDLGADAYRAQKAFDTTMTSLEIAEKQALGVASAMAISNEEDLGGLKDQALAAMRELDSQYEQILGITSPEEAQNRLAELEAQDRQFSETVDTWEQLRALAYPNKEEDAEVARAIMNPEFREWAADNGFPTGLGQAEFDADGMLISYSPGAADNMALIKYHKQYKFGDPNYYSGLGGVNKGTGELFQVEITDPAVIEKHRLADGQYAYIDRADGTRKYVTSEYMARLQPQPGISFIPGSTALAVDNQGGLYQIEVVESGEGPVEITGVRKLDSKEDAELISEATTLLAEGGRPPDPVVFLNEEGEPAGYLTPAKLEAVEASGEGLSLEVVADARAAEVQKQFTDSLQGAVQYTGEPPQLLLIEGERVKRHATHPPGSIVIRDGLGTHVIEADQIYSSNRVSYKSDTTPAEGMNAVLGGYQERRTQRVVERGDPEPEKRLNVVDRAVELTEPEMKPRGPQEKKRLAEEVEEQKREEALLDERQGAVARETPGVEDTVTLEDGTVVPVPPAGEPPTDYEQARAAERAEEARPTVILKRQMMFFLTEVETARKRFYEAKEAYDENPSPENRARLKETARTLQTAKAEYRAAALKDEPPAEDAPAEDAPAEDAPLLESRERARTDLEAAEEVYAEDPSPENSLALDIAVERAQALDEYDPTADPDIDFGFLADEDDLRGSEKRAVEAQEAQRQAATTPEPEPEPEFKPESDMVLLPKARGQDRPEGYEPTPEERKALQEREVIEAALGRRFGKGIEPGSVNIKVSPRKDTAPPKSDAPRLKTSTNDRSDAVPDETAQLDDYSPSPGFERFMSVARARRPKRAETDLQSLERSVASAPKEPKEPKAPKESRAPSDRMAMLRRVSRKNIDADTQIAATGDMAPTEGRGAV
jgi:hypothetical protein